MRRKVDFDDFAENYDALAASQTKFFDGDSSYFARYKIDRVQQLADCPASILEFGCGIGRNITYLREAFPNAEITGCDVSAASLAIARTQNSTCQFVTNGELDQTALFDVILVSCVLHHVPPEERQDALGYCHRHLRRGGLIVLFEHNPFNPLTRYLVATCPFDADAVLLTRWELLRRLNEASFRVVGARYCLFFPQSLSALRRLENYLGWLPLGGQYLVWATTR